MAEALLQVFARFWNALVMDEKSITTKRRYGAGPNTFGGYPIERAISEEYRNLTAHELLLKHLDVNEGPMIHPDNKGWQVEIDMVCRKLNKFLKEMED